MNFSKINNKVALIKFDFWRGVIFLVPNAIFVSNANGPTSARRPLHIRLKATCARSLVGSPASLFLFLGVLICSRKDSISLA